jgi:hypothetical protein
MTTPNVAIAAATREVQTTLKLPSGIELVVYKGKGKDILTASRMIDVQRDGNMSLVFALASLKCTFDGERKTYEDILELSDEDTFEVLNATTGKARKVVENLLDPAPATPSQPTTLPS